MRPPESDVEKIAVLRESGGPFDFAVALTVDWDEISEDLKIRQLAGTVTPDHIRPIEALAVVGLAYYAPHLLGVDVDELESPTVDAEILDEEDPT